MNTPKILLLSLAITVALSACKGGDDTAVAPAPAADSIAASPAYTLDDTKLPPVNRFQANDLDAAKSACTDFAGHVNGKWLKEVKIPSDRPFDGAFFSLRDKAELQIRAIIEDAAKSGSTDNYQLPQVMRRVVGRFVVPSCGAGQ